MGAPMAFLHHVIDQLLHGVIELLDSHLPKKTPRIEQKGDTYILRSRWSFRAFSLIAFPVFSLVPFLIVAGTINNPAAFHRASWEFSQVIFLVGLFLSPLVLGGYLLGESFRVRLSIGRAGIVACSPWRRKRAI